MTLTITALCSGLKLTNAKLHTTPTKSMRIVKEEMTSVSNIIDSATRFGQAFRLLVISRNGLDASTEVFGVE
jgi:hypothetical protein